MQNIISKYPYQSLILLSLICGVIWRIEIEYHGWYSLKWISYFHFAVPVGFGMFLIWANFLIEVNWWKRFIINIISIIYGVFIFYILVISSHYRFQGGGVGLMMYVNTPRWLYYLYCNLILIIIPIIPLGGYFILKISDYKITRKRLISSLALGLSSIPLALFILNITNHIGGVNFIHTIKSGVIIPLIVFSVGYSLINLKNQNASPKVK